MSGENIRILVIDDDVELTRTVCDALESQGYEAVAANSGEQGLELKRPLREGATPEAIGQLISYTWRRRTDRGAEARLALYKDRAALKTAVELGADPHPERHPRGGGGTRVERRRTSSGS